MRRLSVLVLLVAAASLLLISPAYAFSDVPTSHRFAKAINDLSARGIIGGYDDGTFRPDALVNRQQFAKMIVGALYLPVSEADICPFADVPRTEGDILYPDHYVAVAVANGITKGYSATSFAPGNNINRAHVVTMVVRALEALHLGALKPYPAPWFVPGNWDDLSGEHLDNAKLAYYNGLLGGLDYYGVAQNPMTPMPRDEVAQVLYNMKSLLPDVEMTYAWNQAVEFQGLQITVGAPVEDPGQEWLGPKDGYRYVACHISAQNTGAVALHLNPYDFAMRDATGHSYDDIGFTSFGEDLDYADLQPGQALEGWRVFEIPAGAQAASVVYDATFSDVALLVWH